jgi:hypothetical protein
MASFIVYGDSSGQVTVAAPSVAGSNTITFPAETGTLVTTVSTSMPNTIVWDTTVKTSGFTAVAYGGYFCNTTSAAFTVTLPATPTRGDFVVIVDYAGTSATNNITVNPNGGKINGTTSNATINTNRSGLTLTYIDSTQGWLLSSNVYGLATQSYTASYLLVAGGGGGGNDNLAGLQGGGGGGGGYLTGTTSLSPGTVYTAVVGGGGAGNTSNLAGVSGSSSTFTGLTTAVGGGGGGGRTSLAGLSGGSGGGSGNGAAAGSGTPGQGFAGAVGDTAPGNGGSGGGGGASAAATTYNGANGLASSITGTPATYAGGGGGRGGFAPYVLGTGGTGGGGACYAASPAANTGGGGGANGNGSSGVVILSVPTANYSGTTTGSPTITTSGSNTIIKWTTAGSGTYTA